MAKPRCLLIFRFSSLGDVAMTVPVIRNLLQQYPDLKVVMVSVAFVQPLFEETERLGFFTADLKGKHKGIAGMYRLFRELRAAYDIVGVADLHNVLRTKILRSFFKLTGVAMAAIDKGRKEKKEATRKHHKILRPLKTTFERYADVFALLGFPIQLNRNAGIVYKQPAASLAALKNNGNRLIGIAPFAQYAEKMYPVERMHEVIRMLHHDQKNRVYLFGGKADMPQLEAWEREFTHVQSLAGKMSFREELQAIAALDVMVSMDSANMHFASLYGIPVISIWGGTHPYLGFYGWGQSMNNTVQVDLDCRPSSVFGNKPCYRGDRACLNLISPLMVYEKIIGLPGYGNATKI